MIPTPRGSILEPTMASNIDVPRCPSKSLLKGYPGRRSSNRTFLAGGGLPPAAAVDPPPGGRGGLTHPRNSSWLLPWEGNTPSTAVNIMYLMEECGHLLAAAGAEGRGGEGFTPIAAAARTAQPGGGLTRPAATAFEGGVNPPRKF